jgi:KDO2-lipid IV(A) lauroyltransferase
MTSHEPSAASQPSLAYRLQFAGFRLLFGLLAALPWGVSLRIGACIGELLYFLDRLHRRLALEHLAIAFPEKSLAEHQRILRASCRNLGRLAAEFCHLPQLDAQSLPRVVTFAQPEEWKQAVARSEQSGAIVLTAHLGSWELLAHAHGLLGHPVTLIHRPMRNGLVDAAIVAVRARAGTRAIAKKAAAREAIRVLRHGGILAIPSDQNQTTRYGVFVDFFGRSACTTPGVARLAALTGAPVFPVFIIREGESGRHRIEILPQLEMVSTGDRDADAVANTQRCSRVIEEMIRRYPEQWIWFHKRWKTRPGD